jgi:alanine or glycine:cation symporter, AGCS family
MADSNFANLAGPVIEALSGAVFAKINLGGVSVEWIVLWLAIPMVFFTVYLGFPGFRHFKLALDIARGHHADADAPGEVSHFQALATALSGTVGLGSIAGVAVAIGTGGPGAAFWMFVIGLFAMALKMAEVTLGLRYREFTADGRVLGGAMYTLKNGFKSRGWPKLGAALGAAYAIFALGGALPLLQVNQSFDQIALVTGIENRLAYGIGMALLVGIVVVGSVKWLARVTDKLVPVMVAVYLSAALVVIIANISALPAALATIVREAFSWQSATGGALGAFIIGMRRAVFSCESGIGTAVIAHATAKTHHPASEGIAALLEPFLTVCIVCTATALVIVTSGAYAQPGVQGVAMTSAAFATVIDWFPVVLAVAVFLFAYSTLISYGYYGERAWGYLFGESKLSIGLYKFLYCALQPLGAVLALGQVVDLVDSFFFLMALPNVIALYVFAREIRFEQQRFLDHATTRP